MSGRWTRRRVLQAGLVGGVAGLSGCQSDGGGGSGGWSVQSGLGGSPPVDVRGAIYVPARAFNVYQMWHGYDRGVVERDLGYATRVNLNAVRTWASYARWKEDRRAFGKALDHFVSTAADNGLRVLLGLFDAVGVEPEDAQLTDTDLETATAIAEPPLDVAEDRDRWGKPREFVRWFMDRYGDDDRLLAIEVMNEPAWDAPRKKFARGMFETMTRRRGSVPLTVGSTSLINCVDYVEWGADILQFHYNFPRSKTVFRNALDDGTYLGEQLGRRVLMSEWQRVRQSGGGFDGSIEGDEWQPKYRTLAPLIREAGVGSFFWSLMLKPAFTLSQRKMGVINGMFHEDGAVWSRGDARAIKSLSGDAAFEGTERQERPDWMTPDEGTADGG